MPQKVVLGEDEPYERAGDHDEAGDRAGDDKAVEVVARERQAVEHFAIVLQRPMLRQERWRVWMISIAGLSEDNSIQMKGMSMMRATATPSP